MALLEDNLASCKGNFRERRAFERFWATRVRRSTAATLQNELVETTKTRISAETTRNRLHDR
jgi:hypothetical protein